MNVIERIERGEILLQLIPRDGIWNNARDGNDCYKELLRLANIGELCETALQDNEFTELMNRVDKPGKSLSLLDLNILVGLAKYGKSVKIGQQMQWVKITPESLPEDGKPVLVKLDSGETQVAVMGWAVYPKERRRDPWWFGHGVFKPSSYGYNYGPGLMVTHWMPLPDPPKEGE